uniref:BTB domain-containing protein n=1 Tax=Panagrellus redivivus TaxID=6233 RepID=A0A7E4UWV4_PANRE
MSVLKTVTCRGTFDASDNDIAEANKYRPISTCHGTVPYTNNLSWSVIICLNGKKGTATDGHVCATFGTNQNVNATVTLFLDSSKGQFRATLSNRNYHDFGPLQLYPEFYTAWENYHATIRVAIDFDIYIVALNHRFCQSSVHVEKDFTLIVEKTEIKVHRNYLALISPVFNAMFSHRTKEAKSNRVEIVDFDVATVKTVINMCYGYFVTHLNVTFALDMLRFVDKYDIKSARIQLEAYLNENLTVTDFPAIAKYAHDHSRNQLMTICGKFYIKRQVSINKLKEFVDLEPGVVSAVLKAAWRVQQRAPEDVAIANANNT